LDGLPLAALTQSPHLDLKLTEIAGADAIDLFERR